MKIHFKLQSNHYTHKQNDFCDENPIVIDWNYPALPQPNDVIDNDNILGNSLSAGLDKGLTWRVDYIYWNKPDGNAGQIIPEIYLTGM